MPQTSTLPPNPNPKQQNKSIPIEFKATGSETVYNGIPGFFIEGWASVAYPEDRYGDTIGPASETFKRSIATYFDLNPILLYEHGMDTTIGNKPLGQVVSYRFDDGYGLWVKAFVKKPIWTPMLQVYQDILQGFLKTFSIGGLWARQGQEIVEADLCEISVVATPAQPYAVFDLATKSYSSSGKRKGKVANSTAINRTDAIRIVEAGVNYWTEQGKTLLQNLKRQEKAVAYTRKRLAASLKYLEQLQTPKHK